MHTNTTVSQMYFFAWLDLPENKHRTPNTRHEPGLRLKLEVWVTIRIKEARWEPGTGGGCRRRFLERTRAEERKGPGGRRNSRVSSVKKHNSGRQHRERGSRVTDSKARHLKVTRGCESRKEHVAVRRHRIGRCFFRQCLFFLLSYSG